VRTGRICEFVDARLPARLGRLSTASGAAGPNRSKRRTRWSRTPIAGNRCKGPSSASWSRVTLGMEASPAFLLRGSRGGSAAARSGLEQGDIVTAVNRTAVASVAELRAALQAAGDNTVALNVARGEARIYIVLR
jgi:membrane-associated protease RseP (regulator of RpoE activity)